MRLARSACTCSASCARCSAASATASTRSGSSPTTQPLRPELLQAVLAGRAADTVLRVPRDALAQLARAAAGTALEAHLYLVDPMGSWMMRVAARRPTRRKLKRDLDRCCAPRPPGTVPGAEARATRCAAFDLAPLAAHGAARRRARARAAGLGRGCAIAARTPAARLHALTLLTLFLTFDLVLFGAFTRLTDSGLGCPDWPGCYGSASPLGAHERDRMPRRAALPTGPVTHGKAWIEMIAPLPRHRGRRADHGAGAWPAGARRATPARRRRRGGPPRRWPGSACRAPSARSR